MTDQEEISVLMARAREHGAILRAVVDPPYDENGDGTISRVQVRKGIPGVGSDWMPVLRAAEVLRQFLFEQHLDDASKEVATWPNWKRTVLG
jgi:hypothetical protein